MKNIEEMIKDKPGVHASNIHTIDHSRMPTSSADVDVVSVHAVLRRGHLLELAKTR